MAKKLAALAAKDLKPGLRFRLRGVDVEILREREHAQDRFGQPLDRWWSRDLGTGEEGYVSLGPSGKFYNVQLLPKLTKSGGARRALKRKTSRQLEREIAQSLASRGQPQLADLFTDPAATKAFAQEMRHEIQKKQTSEKTAATLAARPFMVKRLEDGRQALFGRYPGEREARAAADRINGWIEHEGRVVYGRAPSDHSTHLGGRQHSTRRSGFNDKALTHARTVALLALSRGERAQMSPVVQRELLKRQWIVTIPLVPDMYEISDAGRGALATSPFLRQVRLEADKKWRC